MHPIINIKQYIYGVQLIEEISKISELMRRVLSSERRCKSERLIKMRRDAVSFYRVITCDIGLEWNIYLLLYG